MYIEDQMARHNFVGLSAAIVKDGRLIWSKGYGWANKEQQTPATDESIFLIASISKTITGVAAMQLVEQGKLDLDTDINDYLPFQLTNPHQPSAVLTCRHLMTHTSGIVDDHYNTVATQNLYYYGSDPKLSLADFCRAFFPPTGTYYNAGTFALTEPGLAFSYSNLGVALLGYIVERAAGQPFDQFTQTTLFGPLGMSKTSWRLQQLPAGELAMPYDEAGKPIGHYTFADYPNGGLRTNVKDLAAFLIMFMVGGTRRGQRILSQASVTEMARVQYPTVTGADRQGLIWGGAAYRTYSNLLGHNGGEQGVNTLMYYNQDTRTGFILLLNKTFTQESQYEGMLAIAGNLLAVGEKQ